jgi:hypothetical protein
MQVAAVTADQRGLGLPRPSEGRVEPDLPSGEQPSIADRACEGPPGVTGRDKQRLSRHTRIIATSYGRPRTATGAVLATLGSISMLAWINGPFGGAKSTTARELHSRPPGRDREPAGSLRSRHDRMRSPDDLSCRAASSMAATSSAPPSTTSPAVSSSTTNMSTANSEIAPLSSRRISA